MYSKILIFECITNLHVGNGDVNYNIIDNEVEKDPNTGYPTINSSGVKGAFREFFTENAKDEVDELFGSDTKKSQGTIKFFSAEFAAMPIRTTEGESAYYIVTTPQTIERINYLSETFLQKKIINQEEITDKTIKVENIATNKKTKISKLEKDIFIIEDSEFRNISLPVIARNKLDNGTSQNLWYEEFVPHGSIFVVPVIANDEKKLKKFTDCVNESIVQFGGGASVGNGFCKISVEESCNNE